MHQADFLNAIAGMEDFSVTLATEAEVYGDYQQHGWQSDVFSPSIEQLRLTKSDVMEQLIQRNSEEEIHVFSGFFSHPLVWKGFHGLKSSPSKRFAYSEAFDPRGWKGPLRRLKAMANWKHHGKQLKGVFAVGGRGVDFFRSIKVPRHQVIPFGYFFNPDSFPRVSRPEHRPFRILFIGRIVPLKGLDKLLAAWTRLNLSPNVAFLELMGDGPIKNRLEKQCGFLMESGSVVFSEPVQHDAAREAIASADLVVLPSRCDGWGAPVSEALHLGTPVICTNRCGVAPIVEAHPEHGIVVPHDDVEALTVAIQGAVYAGPYSEERREGIRNRVGQGLCARRAVGYFINHLTGRTSALPALWETLPT